MRPWIKICGLTDRRGLEAALDAGASAIGFVFAASPRRIDPAGAARLARELPAGVQAIAVFHRPDARALAAVLDAFVPDALQLEPEGLDAVPEAWRGRVIPVFHDHDGVCDEVRAFVARHDVRHVHLEGPGRGGRGVPVDRGRARRLAAEVPLVLAGGLTPDNVAAAIRAVRPFGVDVSSGVESAPGVKDPQRIRAFCEAARAAAAEEMKR
ncbi:MAG: phosphoribosylanthranilate isomerase [Acidobacteriota bacterium]